ncbi:nuclear transport factor 2 family protein [Amycolatopsis alkalitolerans]|uniref:Nuclear transport factor 2 family protein n=1 Tax=Amycolatopsis alkalitolerans TaxID=2547244 RepID=A0A5C4M0B8_9PSEU|nr:nuclear transport factor 2 family protein [Amycolatopsis alkalitolerans]TNC24890.1 nuclear transport factor 2 family protein [Amycolatopsis alkalitolerans]
MTQEKEVLDLVDRWAHAELTGDIAAYPALLDARFTGIGPVGVVLDRDQWAARHQGGLENHEFEVLEPHVRFFGNTAIVEGVQRQRTTARGNDTSGSFRLGLVAVRAGDEWRIAQVQLSGPLLAPGEKPAFAR